MPAPSSDRWAEIEPLLDQALDLAPERRSAFLAQHCSGDPVLRGEVERVLRASEAAGTFLEEPAPAYAAPLVAWAPERQPLAPGEHLGSYLIERELGRGGMGLVLLAQDLRHDRRVALKVIRPDVASLVGAERFGREIQLAARLQHPNIVSVMNPASARAPSTT